MNLAFSRKNVAIVLLSALSITSLVFFRDTLATAATSTDATDTTRPVVKILIPTSLGLYTTSEKTINISALITDPVDPVSGITATWTNAKNGKSGAVIPSIYGWVAPNVPLEPGMNYIGYTAQDASGNKGFAYIFVTYNAPGGTTGATPPPTASPTPTTTPTPTTPTPSPTPQAGQAVITIISPTGDESWTTGNTQNIAWRLSGFRSWDSNKQFVKIELLGEKGGSSVICELCASESTGGSYSWTVGSSTTGSGVSSGIYRIRLTAAGDLSGGSATITSNKFSLVSTPRLSIELDPSSLASQIVTPGTTDVKAAAFKVSATNSEITLSTLSLQFDFSNSATAYRYTIYEGTRQIASGYINKKNIVAKFSESVVIPRDGSKVLTVKIDTGQGTSGVKTGDTITVSYDGDNWWNTVGSMESSPLPIYAKTQTDVRAKSVTIGTPPPPSFPDLVVSSLTHSPLTVSLGVPVTLTAIIKNIGSSSAPESIAEFRAAGGKFKEASQLIVPTLNVGSSYTISKQFTFTSADTYQITVLADATGVVNESNPTTGQVVAEVNNSDVETIGIGGDVSARNLKATASGLSVEVCNNGTSRVSNLSMQITARRGTSIVTKKPQVAQGGLAAGRCTTEKWPYSDWSMQTGNTYTVTAKVDVDNEIQESNENNNTTAATITVFSRAAFLELDELASVIESAQVAVSQMLEFWRNQ